jgi:hypothetical protein
VADGQVIRVTGSGFSPSASIAIIECETGATGESGCDLSTLYTLTSSTAGSFSTHYIASRYLNLSSGTVDCAAPGACGLAAANESDTAEVASIRLRFDPTAPPPPALALAATVSPTGTVNTKNGVAIVSGTVTCNRPAMVSIYGQLTQIYLRFIFSSNFGITVLCKSSRNWTVRVQPTNGLFGIGGAKVTGTASGSIGGTYSQVPFKERIRLSSPVA